MVTGERIAEFRQAASCRVEDLPPEIRTLYPFSPDRFHTSQGAEMSYVDEGPHSDEAVLLLHGNPTWSFYYRDLIQLLSPTLRCVAPDHIGMGLSAKPQNYCYTLEQRISDIEELVDRLSLKRIRLVVHDWGGAIGFGLATRRPDLVERIIVMNTAAFVSLHIPARIALCRVPFLGAGLVRGLNGFAWPATWMAMHARSLTAAEKAGYLWPYHSWHSRVGVHQFVRDIPIEPDHRTRKTLQAIENLLPTLNECPKLFVWGGRDFCFDDTFLERWRELFPTAKIERLTEVGHYVLEDGGALVRERIADFIRSKPNDAN